MRDGEDRFVYAVVAGVGAIPVAAALVVGDAFGVAPTIGLGGLVIGAIGLIAPRRPGLPEARLRARSAGRARRRGSAAG
jgi:hypothetical protein